MANVKRSDTLKSGKPNLSQILTRAAGALGIRWGWKEDPAEQFHSWVLYVDLPDIGQVSFHSATRREGPDYPGAWDGTHKSAERVCAFCDRVLALDLGETERLFDAGIGATASA